MSATPLSRIIRFLLIAAGLIIVLSIVWSFVDSTYTNFLSWIARGAVPGGVTVQEQGGSIYFIHSLKYMGGSLKVEDWIDAAAIQFGLLLAVALMAATPGLNLKRRFVFTGTALAVTFVLQVLSVIVMARTYNSLFFVIVSDVFPLVLWAGFSLRYLFAAFRPAQAEAGPPSRKDSR
jgi:hypothetical protein